MTAAAQVNPTNARKPAQNSVKIENATYDPALIVDETVTIVVQVNGKVRDKLELAPDVAEEEVRERALASAKVQSAMEGRALKKFIYVPGRLASVVV